MYAVLIVWCQKYFGFPYTYNSGFRLIILSIVSLFIWLKMIYWVSVWQTTPIFYISPERSVSDQKMACTHASWKSQELLTHLEQLSSTLVFSKTRLPRFGTLYVCFASFLCVEVTYSASVLFSNVPNFVLFTSTVTHSAFQFFLKLDSIFHIWKKVQNYMWA